ncbi:hypothetical protein AMTR_s00119p00071140, partial [Amborella trichopoda]
LSPTPHPSFFSPPPLAPLPRPLAALPPLNPILASLPDPAPPPPPFLRSLILFLPHLLRPPPPLLFPLPPGEVNIWTPLTSKASSSLGSSSSVPLSVGSNFCSRMDQAQGSIDKVMGVIGFKFGGSPEDVATFFKSNPEARFK